MQKNISVCIPTYNGAKYIREQLVSILEQLGVDDEIIISDDGSIDDTVIIIQNFFDDRIKIFQNTHGKKSVCSNIENALKYAQRQYVFLADQDDVWLPKKVEVMLNHLQHAQLVVSNAYLVDYSLSGYYETLFVKLHSGPGFIKNLSKNTFVGCCMAFERKVLDLVLPFPAYTPMHDWWIGLVCSLCCDVEFVDKPLMLYRRHDSNVSSTAGKSSFSYLKRVVWRLYLLICALRVFFKKIFSYV